MKTFLGKIFKADIVKISSLNAVATLIRMLTGFVSVKVVAVIIGPPGVALLGQLNNFSSIFLTLSAGGINSGITRYTSQHKNSRKRYMAFLRTGFRITVILSVISGCVLIIGSGYFSKLILKDIQYRGVFVIFGFTVILYALNAFLVATINGFREFKKYVTINILSSIVGLIFSVILATSFGIYGALISAVTYQSVVFIVTLTLVTKMHWFKWKDMFGRFSKPAAVKLAHYSM
ncbi:MAG: Na+-driven multidrug efflux pump, partial [Chitinophagaceae bacterium]|nr:Na+-driven multidrug efflux pump [Chitinophagaceae bacterium]